MEVIKLITETILILIFSALGSYIVFFDYRQKNELKRARNACSGFLLIIVPLFLFLNAIDSIYIAERVCYVILYFAASLIGAIAGINVILNIRINRLISEYSKNIRKVLTKRNLFRDRLIEIRSFFYSQKLTD